MRVEVRPSAADAASAAAEFVVEELRLAIAARGHASLALSGGNSPLAFIRELAARSLDWGLVSVFQVDERIAPAGAATRNLTSMQEALVGRGPLPAQNLHPMPVEMPDLHAACAAYETSLGQACGNVPVLDVVHLGLGTDGHTASLFPGDSSASESRRDVAITAEHAGFRRMTLTLAPLNRARGVVWFVVGADKAAMLTKLADGALGTPAGAVNRAAAVIFADRAAGGPASR